jgi:hypothetical protein
MKIFLGILLPCLLAGCSVPGTPAATRAGEVPQVITFSGALAGIWTSARVTQCEVQPVLGSIPGRAYSVFIKGTINGSPYDLTISLVNYAGPGRYVGAFPSGPSLGTLYRDPPSRLRALGEYDTGQPAVVMVNPKQDGGTIDAYFAPDLDPAVTAQTGQFVDSNPSRRVHVVGSWSCGRFPIRHTPRPSSSP